MDEVQEGSIKRRRRKTARKKAVTWPEYWRGSEFGRHIFIGMCLLGAAYAGTFLWETRWASRHYPPVKIGMTPSEVNYLLGAPRAVEAGGTVYRYSDRGREVAVRFSQAGRMVSIACAAGTPAPATCPRIHGIGIGTHEYDVLRRFGLPSREEYSGEEKTMYYDNVGTAFQLRLLKVTQLEVHAGASAIGFVPRGLFAMIP